MNGWFKVECNLCGQQLPVDKDFSLRSWKHKEFHRFSLKNKSQNRILGVVEWNIVVEPLNRCKDRACVAAAPGIET